jgi:hypothetical protein
VHTEDERSHPPAAGWIAGGLCILYGFAKLTGAQFTVLDSELTKPMGEVSGFWLTWYYFGFSPIYGSIVALLQIVGGVLLFWPRTALLGALLLTPVIANIILIDVFYRIDIGATAVALLILGCLLAVIAPYRVHLQRAVLLEPARPGKPLVRTAVVAGLLLACGGFTWWVANYNNRSPTSIDGVWSVVSQTEPAVPAWRLVFFERNRANLVVFRSSDGTDEQHHFEMAADGTARVWQTWLTKGRLLMQGGLNQDGRLRLELLEGPGSIVLERSTIVAHRRAW